MAAVCPKIQNGGQNDTFWPNENMALYTSSYCDWSVYSDVLGYKEYILVVFKIQNGRHIQENSKWPPKWRIIWPKYSYDILVIHHHLFELKCTCVSFWILLDMSNILQLFLKNPKWLLCTSKFKMASKMSLFWPNNDYTTYASNYLYV